MARRVGEHALELLPRTLLRRRASRGRRPRTVELHQQRIARRLELSE
ncbi:MAG: hypothetical protein ACR2HD_06900 [Solirubrobacteraceae bacterium]